MKIRVNFHFSPCDGKETTIGKIDKTTGKLCDALLAEIVGDMAQSYIICHCILEHKLDEVTKGSTEYMSALLLFSDPINREVRMTSQGSNSYLRVGWSSCEPRHPPSLLL